MIRLNLWRVDSIHFINKLFCFCLDQYCYELVYKQRKIQNKKVEAEENDNHTAEIDASAEVDGTGEVNKAVVKGPTAYSNW